jgi:hypothetical protein
MEQDDDIVVRESSNGCFGSTRNVMAAGKPSPFRFFLSGDADKHVALETGSLPLTRSDSEALTRDAAGLQA